MTLFCARVKRWYICSCFKISGSVGAESASESSKGLCSVCILAQL